MESAGCSYDVENKNREAPELRGALIAFRVLRDFVYFGTSCGSEVRKRKSFIPCFLVMIKGGRLRGRAGQRDSGFKFFTIQPTKSFAVGYSHNRAY